MFSKKELINIGFEGFIKIKHLKNDMTYIPDCKGLYIVYKENSNAVKFSDLGTGGFFKGKNPNVSIEKLNNKWVLSSNVLYIGRAGGTTYSGREYKSTLKSRIKQYIKFGQGKNIGHWGGRYIWQLSNPEELLIAYKTMNNDNPVLEERKLIEEFEEYYGIMPFANLK
ncbi:MAG: hypothetical protein FH753_18585 [Firmicutes bacterium]|nr:hypothetical protein [Bacillota bacterium]